MMFFKGIHWYEWLLVGVVVASLMTTKIIWDKYTIQTQALGGVTVENTVLNNTVDYLSKSATITDNVVATFVQENIDEKERLDKSREGVIDEYISLVKPPRVDDNVAPTITPRPKEDKVRTTIPTVGGTDTEHRLGVLADRLHKHYCEAAPIRGVGCTPTTLTDECYVSPPPTQFDLIHAQERYRVVGVMSADEARFLLMADHWLLQTAALGQCNRQLGKSREWINKHRDLEKQNENLRNPE